MDKAYVDSARADFTRCNVYDPKIDAAIVTVAVDSDKNTDGTAEAANLTRNRLITVLSDDSPQHEDDTTITGSIQPQGTNMHGLTGVQALYQHTLFTAGDVREGDRITDCNNRIYEVHATTEFWHLDSFKYYQAELYQLRTVTRKTRSSASAYTYTSDTIFMNMALQGQSSINPQSYFGPHDYVGVTVSPVFEGDEIVSVQGNTYEVMQVREYPFQRSDLAGTWKVCVLVKQFPAVTLRTLTLGSADSTTGLYPPSFSEATAYMQIFSPSKGIIKTPVGYYGKYDFIGLTSAAVYEGDQVTDAQGTTYEVNQVISYLADRSDLTFTWYVCGLTQRDFSVQPSTSGVWHLDSQSAKTDPRWIIKDKIDTYLTAASVKLDNNTTNASTHTMFDGSVAPITRIFTTKDLDVCAVISRGTTNTLYTDWLFKHKPYGFEEQVHVDIYAVNKSDVTATRIAEAYEQELRRIFTTYDAYGNVRDLDTIQPDMTDLGYGYLYHTGVNLKYKHNNDSFDPTASGCSATITWGPSASATGTYTFPNITSFQITDPSGDVYLAAPGRIGEILQVLGAPDFTIDLTCDMSIEPAAKTWKRAQAGAKTDSLAYSVFLQIKFDGEYDASKVYQTFNYGGGATIPVRIEEIKPSGDTLTIKLKRYTATAPTTYPVKYGVSA